MGGCCGATGWRSRRAGARPAAGLGPCSTGPTGRRLLRGAGAAVQTRRGLPRFDLVFRQFWGRTRQIIIPSDTGHATAPPPIRLQPAESAGPAQRHPPASSSCPRSMRTAADGGAGPAPATRRTTGACERALLYSAEERLHHLDFADFSEDELAAARAIMAGLALGRPAQRRTRRLAPGQTRRRAWTSAAPCAGPCARRACRYILARRGPRRKPGPWCCSATSAARWPPTPASCSISCTPSGAR